MNRQNERQLLQTLVALVNPLEAASSSGARDNSAPLPLLQLASRHRVSSYVNRLYPGGTSLRALLLADRAQEKKQRHHDLKIIDHLRTVTEPIVLKGLVSKQLLTPDIARRSSDLDLLIGEEHIDGVSKELAALGYRQTNRFMPIPEYRKRHHHDAPWVLEGTEQHTVEVHWHPLRNPIGSWVPVDRFFSGAVEMTIGEGVITRLSNVDFAFNLIVHAFEGEPTQLRAVVETALAVLRLSDSEVEQLAAAGSHPEVARVMAWSLTLVEVNFPGAVPEVLLDSLFGQAKISKPHRLIGERVLDRCGIDLDLWYGFRLGLDPLLSESSAVSALTGAARVMATEVRKARRSAGKTQ